MFHLDDAAAGPHALRLARVHVERDDLWPGSASPHRKMGCCIPLDATLHDILFTRHGVTFVVRGSTFPKSTGCPLPWLASLLGKELSDGTDSQA